MQSIRSKFSIAQAMILPGFLVLFTCGLSVLLFFTAFYDTGDKDQFFLSIAALIFAGLCILSIRHYFKLLNTIKITTQGLSVKGVFKNKEISWQEIKRIKLTGKEPETFLFVSMPMEAMSIELKDGRKEIFFIKYYTNMSRIRMALHCIKNKLHKKEEVNIECLSPVNLSIVKIRNYSLLDKYDNNYLLSINGILIYGWVIFSIYLMFFVAKPGALLPVFIVSLVTFIFLYGLYGYQLHYFLMDKEYLIIKNHVWPWRTHKYFLADIKQIVFEQPHKMSTSLRVITNNYESYLYPAGSLRSKTWHRLHDNLSKQQIKIRTEAFF